MYVRFRYSGKAVFWRNSVRFCGFRTPLRPPLRVCYGAKFTNFTERFAIEFRKTNTKIITQVNHKVHGHPNSKKLDAADAENECVTHHTFWVYF